MKIYLFVFCLMSICICKSQSRLNLSIHQDLRLLLVGDERGNEIFTPDILVKLEVEAFKIKNSSIYLYFGLEYAALNSSSLSRFSLGFGYVTSFSFLQKSHFGIFVGHGLILRSGGSFMGLGADLETSYPISKKIRLSLLYQIIDRNDLTTLFHTNRNIKGSIFIGLKMPL
jgi:hypothetical protein